MTLIFQLFSETITLLTHFAKLLMNTLFHHKINKNIVLAVYLYTFQSIIHLLQNHKEY